ncbi:sterol desaturase family protein [candidate division KSB1 bacterium]|nr:sterol desaturase family protein [candidate division KSB1 bacterium]
MQTIIDFFETISPAYRTAILVTGLVGFWALEGAMPLFSFKYSKIKHALLNLFFILTTLVVNFVFAFFIIKACDFTTVNKFGLLYLADLPLWLHVMLGVLLLDFIGAYLIHWIHHQVKWMWKFHLIHHTDTKVDVTTSLRHHPGESLFRVIFALLAILIAGVPVGVVMIYQTLSALFAQITHANIKTPAKIDRLLSYIFVTPKMHKVHHHFAQPLTDTNYGNIFSIWDRLFRTFVEVETKTLQYGIDTHMQMEEHSSLKNLLAIPFQAYRAPGSSKFGDENNR